MAPVNQTRVNVINITSTVRTAIIATALILAVGAGAQARIGALDVANTGLSVAPGKIHSVHQVKDNDSLLYEILIDGNDGATHSVRVNDAGRVINHPSRTNVTHAAFYASSNGGGMSGSDGESATNEFSSQQDRRTVCLGDLA